MGVGINLNGRYSVSPKQTAPEWLANLKMWIDDEVSGDSFWGCFNLQTRVGATYDDAPALFFHFYPASEDVEFVVPRPGRLRVTAKTSIAGPGYHTALCRFLRWFGETMSVTWNPPGDAADASLDETGYFFTGDRDAVERAMLQQIQQMATITLDNSPDLLQAWNMPLDVSFANYPGGVRTPLGVRSREWVEAVADDPGTGRDFYPWWDEGMSGSFHLGRALCDMWSNVRWGPVLTGEEEDHLDLFVCDDLIKAHAATQADPKLKYPWPFPWREWGELVDILEEFEGATNVDETLLALIRNHARCISEDEPLVGYRRYPIEFRLLDGWLIELPGRFAGEWKESTWSAFDGSRTVWFTCWGVRQQDGSPVPAESILETLAKGEAELLSFHTGDLFGVATKHEIDEGGQKLLNLKSYVVTDGKYAFFNFFLNDPSDLDWAVAVWRAVKCPGPPTRANSGD